MRLDKSRSPYFDDHDASDKYHDVLFVPSRAVQVRELNNIQTLFKEQIGRFGDHIFEEGSIVIPGETNYDLEFPYLQVDIQDLQNISGQLGATGLQVRGRDSDVLADVRQYVSPEGSDLPTFYLKYVRGSSDGELSTFADNEIIDILNAQGSVIGIGTNSGTGFGSRFTTSSGVYYINKRFVLVDSESIIIDKYSSTPSKSVGFLFDEIVVTSTEDSGLVDNAQGEFNFTAPGADRLRVDTQLHVIDLVDLDNAPDNYIEIFRIDEGNVKRYARGPEYNILNDVLAERTYEQSGDYTVESFGVALREHLNDGTNNGVFMPNDGGDESKFVTQVEKGIAYVRGYRIENLSTLDIEVDKARITQIIDNSSLSAALGYYMIVNNPNVIPNIAQLESISFYSGAVSTPGNQPSGSVVGTGRVRFIRREGGNYRLYLFDIRDSSGNRSTSFLSNAVSVYASGNVPFTATLDSAELYDTGANSLVYPLNVDNVKTLYDSLGASDTSYTAIKQLSGVLDSNGMITFTAAPNEVFVSQDSLVSFASLVNDQTIVEVAGNFTLGGSPSGSTITLDYGVGESGKEIRANLVVAKENVVQKTKTLTTHTVSGSLTNGRLSLDRADAYEIVSVTDNDANDVTDQFTLFENKRPSFYDISYVEGPSNVEQPVSVEFRFFQHSSGDYFGADSYPDLEYDEIPVEDGRRLSDVLDFRPRIANDGVSFVGTGSSVGNLPVPFSIIRSDIEHYLPRIDKVYVNFKGEFGVKKGIPSLTPTPPSDPSQSMILYQLSVPAYTFDSSDIQVEKVNNRRYTMKDIGRLENRISNLEYYVSLSSLEQDADSQQIIDPDTGLNRFKNGFMVDSFVDHSVGDYNWDGYRVSVGSDDGFGVLRPEMSINAFDLELNDVQTTNVVVNNGIVTLPYTNMEYIVQDQVTSYFSVNEFPSSKWIGMLKLSTYSDLWFDANYSKPDVNYNSPNNENLHALYNSWSKHWTGVPTKNTKERLSVRRGGNDWKNSHSSSWKTDITTNSETTTTANTDVVEDRIVDKSVVPYMRSIDIGIDGLGNKPRTRMHFFFDGRIVDQFIKPQDGDYGDPVVTNSSGEFVATFTIPSTSSDRFRAGEKTIVVTDDMDADRRVASSYAEALFEVSGAKVTRQQNIIATRRTATQSTIGWVDPIAQSFSNEVEGGCFVTSLDLFFRNKDSNDNVTVKFELREMENGRPTTRHVPGTKVIKKSSDITTSSDASVATTFDFDYPVYLQDGTEYCFVISTNSVSTEVFYAEFGEDNINNDRAASAKPQVGVLFKAQGRSAWKEDVSSVLAFTLNRAQFTANTGGSVYFDNSEIVDFRLQQNAFQTTAGSNELIVLRDRHNYVAGAMVQINGSLGGNGIGEAEINGTHEVLEVLDPGRFVIGVNSNAVTDGRIGGSSATISNMFMSSILQSNISDIQHQNTTIGYQYRGTTGKSIDGNETPYQDVGGWKDIENKINSRMSRTLLVSNRYDESVNFSGNRTFRLRANMETSNPNISPVIDLNGACVITPNYMIDSKQSIEADGSNNWSNYRGEIIVLDQPATSLKVFSDINRPPGSEVIVTARFGNSVEEVRESDWQEVDGINTLITGDSDEYLENEYGLENVSEYTAFQIMIQLKSQSSTQIPTCRRLRAIALGT